MLDSVLIYQATSADIAAPAFAEKNNVEFITSSKICSYSYQTLMSRIPFQKMFSNRNGNLANLNGIECIFLFNP